MFEAVLFYLFALLALGAGVNVVTRRNPIASAVSLVVTFFALAAIYALLGAHFVAVIQILVYAGAIMVLFLFVIMLLNVRVASVMMLGDVTPRQVVGLFAAGLLGGALVLTGTLVGHVAFPDHLDPTFGTIEQIGLALFGGRYLLPFELVSVLLTVAVVGAVVLAKKEL